MSPIATNLKYATANKNARLDAITTYAGGGALLKIYDGTQPANPNTAVSTQVMLASLVCGTPFAAASSGGVLTANAITNATAAATSTAAWFRLWKSDGTTAVMDGTVGTSGCDLNLASTAISSGTTVSVTSFVLTAGN